MNIRLAVVLFFLSLCMPALAQQDNNAQKALQKAQFMLRQAASEKAELQTQVESLKQQIDKLTRDLADSKSSAENTKQKLETTYGSAIEQWKQRDGTREDEMAALKKQLAQQIEQDKNLQVQLQKQTQNFTVCYENNKKFYDINTQLLSRYENKGFGDVLKQKEPFTGIKQVEVENLVQDYRYQLDGLKLQDDQSASNAQGDGKQTGSK